MTVRCGIAAFIMGICCCSMLPALSAGEYAAAYVFELAPELPENVIKSIDAAGRVSYSAGWPKDTVAVEVITIEPGPSAADRANSKRRFEQMTLTAEALAKSRAKRQAQREEEEKKRLERLALQRAARPQVYETRVYVGWNPLWWSFHRHGHTGPRPHQPAHLPSHHSGFTRSAAPRHSSFK